MSEGVISEKVFDQAMKRIDEGQSHQDMRIESLEKNYAIVHELALHMERLATNMESMAKELAKQGEKLNDLEAKPSKRWDLIVTTIITTIIGAIIGMVLKGVIVP